MEVAIAAASTAQEVGAVKAATLAGRIEAFEGSLETASITLGEKYTPALGGAIDAGTALVEGFNNMSGGAQGVTAGLLATTTAVAGVGGGLILLAPRIVSTVDAFRTLGTMAGVSGSSLTSFAGTLGGLLGPLALVAAGVYAVNKAFDVLDPKIESTAQGVVNWAEEMSDGQPGVYDMIGSLSELQAAYSQSRQEMEGVEKGLSTLVPGYGFVKHGIVAVSEVAREVPWEEFTPTEAQIKQLDDLTQGYYSDMTAMEQVEVASSGLADGWGNILAPAAVIAAQAADGLTEALAGITVADKVLELDTGALAMYNMAAAAGASDQALVDLGVQLGLFTEAEAGATRATQEAAIEFAATGDEEAYRRAVVGITTALIADKVALAEAAGGLEHARGGMQEGTEAADGFRGGLDRAAGGLDAVESGARDVAAAIQSIPTSWSINVNTHYSQSGVPPTAGGEAWVPGGGGAIEGSMQHGAWNVPTTGPRVIHQGEMVIPAGPAERMRQGEIGGAGNKTIVLAPIIIDSMQAHDATGAIMFEALAEMIQSQTGGIM